LLLVQAVQAAQMETIQLLLVSLVLVEAQEAIKMRQVEMVLLVAQVVVHLDFQVVQVGLGLLGKDLLGVQQLQEDSHIPHLAVAVLGL
jgi:hypothetical protein